MSNYESSEPRSNFGLFVLLAFIAAALIGAGLYFTQAKEGDESTTQTGGSAQEDTVATQNSAEEGKKPFDPDSIPMLEPEDSIKAPTPEEMLVDAGMGAAELDPETLLKKIGQSLEKADLKEFTNLIGSDALDENQLKALQEMAAKGDFKLSSLNPVVEIGEIEANRRARWALNLEGEGKERIYFELERKPTGEWSVAKVNLPTKEETTETVVGDSLGVTDAFLNAALAQDFDAAKSFVDSGKVSDAKIAGLCIIFEEAKYKLRDQKPLRAMFNRELTAGFIAHVENDQGEKAADFGISLQRASAENPWRISEVNLDSLLADYANRVAGGDVHFTPLVKNPAGGDTLILYFGFDEDGLTPRTKRQLDIVAGLLKLDPNKKLTLSGHTDALGSDDYNNTLSGNRAGSVEKYLLGIGVPREQIVALAEGEAKPRRPNSTEDGEDNPTGRRANRRTEIYLDF